MVAGMEPLARSGEARDDAHRELSLATSPPSLTVMAQSRSIAFPYLSHLNLRNSPKKSCCGSPARTRKRCVSSRSLTAAARRIR